MAAHQLGLGTLIKVDENDDGASHTTCTLVTEATPPARKRERIDKTTLSDTLSTYGMGIETHSEFVFTQYWEPGDTQHESVDTLFGAKTVVEWQVVYVDATVDEFEGIVSDIEPDPIKKDNFLMRKVTIQRTGAITRT